MANYGHTHQRSWCEKKATKPQEMAFFTVLILILDTGIPPANNSYPRK
jgi:hypothetical protein